jgi:hypothetical protein
LGKVIARADIKIFELFHTFTVVGDSKPNGGAKSMPKIRRVVEQKFRSERICPRSLMAQSGEA